MTPLSSVTSSPLAPVIASAGGAPFHRRVIFKAFGAMKQGNLRIDLPDGSSHEFGAPAPHADATASSPGAVIHVRNETFFKRCFWSGDIGFGESYVDGDWETPDLCAVIAFFVLNVAHAPTLSGSRRRGPFALNFLSVANRLGHLLRASTRATARRNISEHYDLSNAFFALWLDPSMMYSAAIWPPHARHFSLADAQSEKNDALCRKLQLQASDHVLEIGTGWGGWALHAASHYGCRVTSITLSREQFDLARRRVIDARLSERIDVRLCDFRDVGGRFDKIVSIEMVEALGHRYQATFADAVSRLLKPDGLLALQFITCPDSRYKYFRRGVDFIQKHIFPGSLLLSLNRLNGLLAKSGDFTLHAMEDFGPDYARTLRLWREAFETKTEQVRGLGFDERFIRKWSYYLSYCETAFALRNISVVHALYTRPNNLSL
jgi:cyclopropane-fatty-acyl-phospholipid synthase